jgi:hypothetical protein
MSNRGVARGRGGSEAIEGGREARDWARSAGMAPGEDDMLEVGESTELRTSSNWTTYDLGWAELLLAGWLTRCEVMSMLIDLE